MFCKICGAKLDENEVCCSKCGTKTDASTDINLGTQNVLARNESEQKNLGKKHIFLSLKAILVVLMVAFFFPMCTVSCAGEEIAISASDATFGLRVLGEKFDGNLLFCVLLIIPVVLLVYSFIAKYIDGLIIANIIGSVMDIVALIIFAVGITNTAEKNYATVEFGLGFYLQIILNILLIVFSISIKDYQIEEKKEPIIKISDEKKGWIFITIYIAGIIGFIGFLMFVTK